MADIFGNPSLFCEFEKDRNNSNDTAGFSRNSKPHVFLSSPVKDNSVRKERELTVDDETSGELIEDNKIEADNSSKPNGNDTSTLDYIKALEEEIRQLKESNNSLLHENRLINLKRFATVANCPTVQVLFLNKDFARKSQARIENCLKVIIEESHEEREVSDTSQVAGSCQYLKDFVLDVMGWPQMDNNRLLNDNCNVPRYEQVFRQSLPCEKLENREILEVVKEKRQKTTCFNCGGEHNLITCPEKRDQQRISSARRQFMDKFSPSASVPSKQRYHIEDDPRFSDMKPGIISVNLREALGISSQELPPYIYQMRLLGYPPGHLESAKQLTSGLTMFDKHGQELTSDGELLEDGEVNEEMQPSAEYSFDKIVDYPGFNVELPAGTVDESKSLGMPPMPAHWQKAVMKDYLLSLMKSNANKRKADDAMLPNVAKKHLKREDISESIIDMDIDEAGEEMLEEQLRSSFSLTYVANGMTPLPPPPLPEEPEELPAPPPPPPEDLSSGSMTPELPNTSCQHESLEMTKNENKFIMKMEKDIILTTTPSPLSLVNKPFTPAAGQFGGSRSFSFGTPIALTESDSLNTSTSLPDSSKFASGLSDLILHDNLPNATGTFQKLKVVLTKLKNRSSPKSNMP